MAVGPFTNATILLGGMNLSPYTGEVSLDYKAEMLDATTFGLTARKKLGGLKSGGMTGKGFVDQTASMEEAIAGALGGDDVPITLFAAAPVNGGVLQKRGYAEATGMASLTFGGPVGALLPVNFTAESASDVVRAVCLKEFLSTGTQLSGTAAGAQYNLGAVAANQKLYGGLHITKISAGASITMSILGGATSEIAFTAATATGGQWADPVPGAIAETLWRASWVIAGPAPEIQGLVWVAIQ